MLSAQTYHDNALQVKCASPIDKAISNYTIKGRHFPHVLLHRNDVQMGKHHVRLQCIIGSFDVVEQTQSVHYLQSDQWRGVHSAEV